MEKIVQDILNVIDEKKALDVLLLDVTESSIMTDYMIVCNGSSKTHTQAISNALNKFVKDNEMKIYSLEGHQEGSWILFDLGVIVIHIMDELLRKYYNLESLWQEAKVVETTQI